MISIVTVNWNSYDWINLMIESLQWHSEMPWELIVVDNSLEKQDIKAENVKQYRMPTNIGHGAGLNYGGKNVQFDTENYPYVMFLDADCHFINKGWEKAFLGLMEKYDVVGGRGVPEKPIRPACMFMKRRIAIVYDWRDTPGYKGHRVTPEGFDVAIKAYHRMVKDKVPMMLLESTESQYGTLNGEEWCVDGVPYVYHHWHGTHLKERQVDFPEDDLIQDKNDLFSKIPWRAQVL